MLFDAVIPIVVSYCTGFLVLMKLFCDAVLTILQMSVEFVVSADAMMSNGLLLIRLVAEGVTVQSIPIVRRVLGVFQ